MLVKELKVAAVIISRWIERIVSVRMSSDGFHRRARRSDWHRCGTADAAGAALLAAFAAAFMRIF
jgi:hypothetical protein